MSNQFDKYRVYSGTIKRLVLLTGLWPSKNSSTLYRLVSVIHTLAAFVMCYATISFCRRHISNVFLFLKGLGLALSFSTIVQKVI